MPKETIAEFVNATQIKKVFANAGCNISYQRAIKIKRELKEEHSEVKLPDKRVIPLKWVYETYGNMAYEKEKDA